MFTRKTSHKAVRKCAKFHLCS